MLISDMTILETRFGFILQISVHCSFLITFGLGILLRFKGSKSSKDIEWRESIYLPPLLCFLFSVSSQIPVMFFTQSQGRGVLRSDSVTTRPGHGLPWSAHPQEWTQALPARTPGNLVMQTSINKSFNLWQCIVVMGLFLIKIEAKSHRVKFTHFSGI